MGQGRGWPLLTESGRTMNWRRVHDVCPYIQSLEAFSSQGGMLPEQIWDAPTYPRRE